MQVNIALISTFEDTDGKKKATSSAMKGLRRVQSDKKL